MRCGRCGARNPENFRFCGSCGHPLGPVPSPQRRWATALFFDLTNYTGFTRKHELEDAHRIVNRLLERARDCVTTHGGYVDKFFGDGMLAVFGLQQSSGNEPMRALQAAACMVETTQSGDLEPMRGRVGLATGLVLQGPLGSTQGQHQTVIGNPVNLAQRLASSAPGGVVWLDQATAQLVPEAHLEQIKPRLFKGYSEPQPVWVFRSWKTRNHPLFGRDRELKKVTDWLLEAERGGGRVAVVSGPIGVGKTALIEEALRRRSGRLRTLRLPGLEPGKPLRNTLRQSLVQGLGQPAEAILERLPLADLDRRVLAWALGLIEDRPAPPADLESTLVHSFRHLLELLAAEHPTALLVRSGPRDHVLLQRALSELRQQPPRGLCVLVLRRSVTKGDDLVLGPLQPKDADDYLRYLNPELSDQERTAIYRQSGGLPLAMRFLALSEDPGTSLMAAYQSRLDKLQPLHRKVLLYTVLGQPGSWLGLLRELLGEASVDAVGDLIADGFLMTETVANDGEMALRVADPLLQQAAQFFLSQEEQRRLHKAYWRWLERQSGSGYAALAAEHALLAGLKREAARAHLRAGDALKREGIFRGAERHYLAAIENLPKKEANAARLRLAALHLEGGSPEAALRWLEGETSVEALRLLGLAQARLGKVEEAQVNLGRYLKQHPGDLEITLALLALQPASRRLQRLQTLNVEGTPKMRPAYDRLLAETLAQLGRYGEATAAMRSAYGHYLKAHHESRAAETALAISGYEWMSEHLGAAAEWADRAVEHARKAHPGLATTAWSVRAGLWLDQGRPDQAAAALEQAEQHLGHARTPDERARIHAIRMRFLIETGRLHEALAVGEEVYEHEPHPWIAANLALAYALGGGQTAEQRLRELLRKHTDAAPPPGKLLFALAEALRTWRSGDNPIPLLKAARREARASGPYLDHLTLALWGLYLMQHHPERALALARYLQRRAYRGGFVVVAQTARLIRAEVALSRGEPVEHLLRFEASLAAQETWRRSLLRQLESRVPGPAQGLGGYGILGAWARLRWREALAAKNHGSTRRNP